MPTLPMERVDLDRLVRDIIETFPNGQPIKPEIQIKGKLPQVMGNEALLAQCVSNLLSNGAKFVSPGTTPRLEVSAKAIGKASIRVWFKDNGIGIAPENHERIFRLFERDSPRHGIRRYGHRPDHRSQGDRTHGRAGRLRIGVGQRQQLLDSIKERMTV